MLGSVKGALASAFALASIVNAAAVLDVKRNDKPAPSCTPYTPFKYAGCFSDPSIPSALNYRATDLSNQNMTVEICVAFCKGNNYRYAGLEYYGECFCGSYVNGASIDESNCNYPCSGNSAEACGGTDIISVYQDTTFPVVDTSSIMDYKNMGCYSEGTIGRALIDQQDQLSQSDLTVEKCLSACKQEGYAYAGVEYAYQCFCGVVIGNGSVPIDSSNCNMPCSGDSTETCGGSGTLNLYGASDLMSTQPCGYMPPPPVSSSSTTSMTSTSTSAPTSSSSVPPPPPSSSAPPPPPSSSSPPPPPPPPKTSTAPPPPPPSCTVAPPPPSPPPPPTCEYKCGNWCSTPMPPFKDPTSCLTAASNCKIQLSSCFLQAGFPDSLNCFKYASWCSSVGSYCGSNCPGNSCSPEGCKSKYPPVGPPPPAPPKSPSPPPPGGPPACPPSTTTAPPPPPPPPTVVPVPPPSCVCKVPGSGPVGGIGMPCMTCNNVKQDWDSGNWFKLYTDPDPKQCKSYPPKNVPSGCQQACMVQKNNCMSTYAQSCKSNSQQQINQGADSYNSAYKKCNDQWTTCNNMNQSPPSGAGSLCKSWNSGWQ